MTFFVILAALFLFRELQHAHAAKHWRIERADLYTRIQAGTLQEYQQATRTPSRPFVKDREQKVAEQCADKGIMRADKQYPTHWRT